MMWRCWCRSRSSNRHRDLTQQTDVSELMQRVVDRCQRFQHLGVESLPREHFGGQMPVALAEEDQPRAYALADWRKPTCNNAFTSYHGQPLTCRRRRQHCAVPASPGVKVIVLNCVMGPTNSEKHSSIIIGLKATYAAGRQMQLFRRVSYLAAPRGWVKADFASINPYVRRRQHPLSRPRPGQECKIKKSFGYEELLCLWPWEMFL